MKAVKDLKTAEQIYNAGAYWEDFDYDKGLEVLKELKDSAYYEKALENWPKGIKQSQEISKLMSKSAKKLPKKVLKLENLLEMAAAPILAGKFEEWAKKRTNRTILLAGKRKMPNFDYDKGFARLIKKDHAGEYIYIIGRDWKNFDRKKCFNALVKKDKVGEWIYEAGKYWKEFDYEKGLDALIKVDKMGEYIYYAEINWKKFNYEKGLDALKKVNKYIYEKALKDWPKGIKQSLAISKDIKKRAKTLPKKTLKLEDDNDLRSIEYIYYDGKDGKNFDYKKGLNDLIKLDNSGEYIWRAGWKWNKFNYEKGLEELIKKDKNGRFIYYAGDDWKKFNYIKGLKALRNISSYNYRKALKDWPKGIKQSLAISKDIKKRAKTLPKRTLKLEAIDDTSASDIYRDGVVDEKNFDFKKGFDDLAKADKREGFWIYHAGKGWKGFDYKKGLDVLIKMDKNGRWIYSAGKDWKQFGYKKALKALKNTQYYKIALEDWPMGIKQSKIISKQIKSKAKKLPKKTLKLEDVRNSKTAEQIYNAGEKQKNFNFKKGLDELIKKYDENGFFLYWAGANWKEFDFKKGSEALIKKDKFGYWIYSAGKDWENFSYEKGLKALKNNKHYKAALKYWPKGIKQNIEKSKQIKDAAKKLPKKTLKLENFIEEINNEIY